MFIEKVTLKNLASLRGAWEIDFTQPEYENGIFAIVGTNGAGKSTILDAICLALYGQTPRQKTFNALCDEIMSKDTAFCAASVTFRTAKGRFTARWEHRKTRKNSKNPFSSPERFFSCENDPTICSSKSGEVALLVQEYTGLTFEQFTQSVMLAQFQFEKFLTATPADRTKILEKVTGTEDYKKLVEHAKEISEKYESEIKLLRTQSQMILPRPETEMAEFSAKRDSLKKKIETDEKEIKNITQELTQLLKWNSLQKKILEADRFRKDLETSQNAFLPKRKRLEKAEHAQVVEPIEAQFLAVVAEEKIYAIDIEKLCEKKTDLQKQETEYETKRAMAQKNATQRETNYVQILPKIQKTRELDIHIKNNHAILRQLAAERDSAKTNLEKETENLKKSEENIKTTYEKLKEYWNLLPENERKPWETVSKSNPVTLSLAAEPEILKAYNTKDKELGQLLKTLTEAEILEREIEKILPQLEIKEKETASFSLTLERSRETLEIERRKEEKITEWITVQQRKIQDDAEYEKIDFNLQNTISSLVANVEKLPPNEAETGKKKEKLEECFQKLNAVKEKMVQTKNTLESCQRQKITLQETLSNLRAIQSYEAARLELTDGEPCPLCGAIHHPYAEATSINFQHDSEVERTKIYALEAEKKSLEAELERQEDKEKKIIAEHAKIESGIHALTQERTRILAEIEKQWSALQEFYSQVESRTKLEIKIEKNTAISEILEKFLDFTQEIQDELEERKEVRDIQKKKYQESFCQNEQVRKNVREMEKAVKEQETQFLAQKEAFTTEKLSLNEKIKRLETLKCEVYEQEKKMNKERVPANFTEKIVFWRAISETQTKLWQLWNAIRTLGIEGSRQEAQKKQTEAIFERVKAGFLQKSAECKKREEEVKTLENERRKLLGEQNPDTVENELKNAEKRAKEELEILKNTLLKVEKEREFTEKQLAEKSATHKKLRELANERLEMFKTSLQREMFADEAEYQSAKMTRQEREELTEQRLKLQKQADQLEGIDRQNLREMETFQEKAPSSATVAELETRLMKKEEENRENHQEMGRLTEIFKEQERILRRNAELDGKILKAENEAERWLKLGNVLKSAGTNKTDSFVNFVQSITFNNLLYYANQQLRLLSPRYELRTNPKDPASLQLLDEQHERTPRAPESLSGGESFILSLALALGLTRIASRNVEINSFFIDEGFGSLAPEALEAALNALKNYHSESNKRGKKLIGVISHVDAIHNEVDTAIQVIPYPPRHFSRITGPGVSGSER